MNILKRLCRWLQKHPDIFIVLCAIIGIVLINVALIIGLNAHIRLVWLITLVALTFSFLLALSLLLIKFVNQMRLDENDEYKYTKGEIVFFKIITLGFYSIGKIMKRQKDERQLEGKTLDDYTFIDRLHMTKEERMAVKLAKFYEKTGRIFYAIAVFIPNTCIKIWKSVKNCFSDLSYSMKYGDASTRLNFLFLGSVNIGHGQIGHGIVLLLYQVLYFFYLFFDFTGIKHLIGLITLGTNQTQFNVPTGNEICTDILGQQVCYEEKGTIIGDDSALFLLWGILGVLLLIIFIAVYLSSNRSSIKLQEKYEEGRQIQSFKEELKDYTNSKFHRLLLALPLFGVFLFSILPLIDMILMAFTNYDMNHQTPANLFQWTGFATFRSLFNNSSIADLFWPILWWTLIWAVLATVTNYFLGIIMSLLINKKSIKLKKLWRTALVLSIAVPQFVSLLSMNKFLSKGGYLNQILEAIGFYQLQSIKKIFGEGVSRPISSGGGIDWLSNVGEQSITLFGRTHKVLLAKPMIIIVNLWIGIPYSVLSNTGILMNIPADLYESARIDGASPIKQFFKITLPYVVFVTMPSTITSFIGNINNFNVIYFLTGGGPTTGTLSAGRTDLLITWLYKLTVEKNYFNLASVIGILSFIFSMTIGLIMYKNSKSVKDEEAFM